MLVCLLSCPKIVGPQFVMLMNRITLFRQVLRELPEYKDMFLQLLHSPNGRYKGPTRILVRTLESLGWTFTNGALCTHEDERFFHLFLSPPKQVYSLLSSSWSDYVCTQVNHRKGLEHLESIDLQITKSVCLHCFSPREDLSSANKQVHSLLKIPENIAEVLVSGGGVGNRTLGSIALKNVPIVSLSPV